MNKKQLQTSASYAYGVPQPHWPPLIEHREPTAMEACYAWCAGTLMMLVVIGGAIGIVAVLERVLGTWSLLPGIFIVPCWVIITSDWLMKRLKPFDAKD